MITCQLGHKTHDTKVVASQLGKLRVYDWDKYKDVIGYCPGKDDVSRTIANTGAWASTETEYIGQVLANGDRNNLVIDFGAHIGWFTIFAASYGYDVLAYEGNKFHAELLRENIETNHLKRVEVVEQWIDDMTEQLVVFREVELVKCDLEGAEAKAIRLIELLLENKRVKNLFVEISPIFNDGYPALVEKICKYGYDAFRNGVPFDGNFNFDQDDFLFVRR